MTFPDAVRHEVASADGTPIAYWTSGLGPPLVLVHGTSADHTRWRTVLALLEEHATIHAVDRRGRGGSGDGPEYQLQREFEDVAAVVDDLTGPVDLLGHSHGAICALEATLLTTKVGKLVLYEPPITAGAATSPEVTDRLEELLASGDNEAVVETFFRQVVRMPDHELDLFRTLPAWPARVAAAHTLPRELRANRAYRFKQERFRSVTIPTLLVLGGASPAYFRESLEAVSTALADSRLTVLDGQQHIAMDTAPKLFVDTVMGFLREV